jgi:hypothetical protein
MNVGQQLQLKDIKLMKEICPVCTEDFTAHSFNLLCHTVEGGHIFYTKISNASQYDDTYGIAKHFNNYLNHIKPDKWTWIIDFDEFGLKHTLGLNTGIQLAKLVNHFGKLKYMIALNTNIFVEQMLKFVKITLNKEHHNCIQVLRPNDAFSQEIKQWKSDDDILHTII